MKCCLSRWVWLSLWLALASSFPAFVLAQESVPDPVAQILREAASAREAGNAEGERVILERGLESVGPDNPAAYAIYQVLGQHHADYGNFARAATLAERQLLVARSPREEHNSIAKLVSLYASLHQRAKAVAALERLDRLQSSLRASEGWLRFGGLWQAITAAAKADLSLSQGHLEEAEGGYKACLSSTAQFMRHNAGHDAALFRTIDCTAGLMHVQLATGQLAAAGAVADQQRMNIERTVHRQKRLAVRERLASSFGRLAIEQGRTEEARRILLEALNSMQDAKYGDSSLLAAGLRAQLASVEMLLGRWDKALEWHERRQEALARAGRARGQVGMATVDHAYTLLRLGRPVEALAMLDRIVGAREKKFDEGSIILWEGRAFHGIALAANGRNDEALLELRTAVPRMLDLIRGERTSSEAGALRAARLNWLLDGYLGLLSRYAGGAGDETAFAVDEAFRMADLARGSTVQRALAAAASRAGITDPALAERARKEQDLQREISSLSDALGNLLFGDSVAEQEKIVADMRTELAVLRREHARTRRELERMFPEYAALLDPKPAGIGAIQKLLKPGEAVVSIYAGSKSTLVWAIPAAGKHAFAVVPLGSEQLDLAVETLRQAFDPDRGAGGRLPRFRFDLSHELYSRLLAPVEAGWRGAEVLIVIPHGRLGQLPFALLTTAPFQAAPAKPEYAEMAGAPWLIRQVAVSQLPAVVALTTLRARSERSRAAQAFVGFGDPVFVKGAAVPPAAPPGIPARRRLLGGQGASPAAAGGDLQFAPPIDFKLLPQLPDTALEIEEVARGLAAERGRDVFLRERASEATVKKTDLSGYRVVMFATHGLMSGEMPGLYQPALALSDPAVTGDGEDGMLTMEEILGLRLNADVVVLSACNTAAVGGHSEESVSGLGRAFFHAGAKALLLTNWAVDTESARMLTTEIFRLQREDPKLTGAMALQQSSLALMQKSAGSAYSYAHPLFWAPFSLVGDGGRSWAGSP